MKRGFTLIELMVTVTIGIIMVGVGISSMNTYLAKEHLSAARNDILSSIQMARNYAITTQNQSSFAQQLDYVAVTLTAAGQLTVWPVNLISGSGPSYFTKDVSNDDVVLTPINYQSLLFSVPEGKLLVPDGSAPVDIGTTVMVRISSIEGIADTMSISIGAGGKIQ